VPHPESHPHDQHAHAQAHSSGRRLPDAAVWFSWAIVVLLIGGGLLSLVLRAVGR
jgi:hypothetical protein